MNSAPYISVTDFQNMNPEMDFSQYTPTTISGMIVRASAWVDNYLQYSLSIEDIVEEKSEAAIDSEGNLRIFTQKMPVQSVSSLKLKLGTSVLDFSLTDGAGQPKYEIPTRGTYVLYPQQEIALTGNFSIRNFTYLRGRTIFSVISYRAGYETIPQAIRDAVNLKTKDIFIRQANPLDVKSVQQGAISYDFRDRDETGESDMEKDAKRLLEEYVRRWE